MTDVVDDPLGRSYSVNEFAEAEGISRAHLYALWQHGIGPRFYYSGNVRRITTQARRDYHQEREAAASAAARETEAA